MKLSFFLAVSLFYLCTINAVSAAELVLYSGATLSGSGTITGGDTVLYDGSALNPGTGSDSGCLTMENPTFLTGGQLSIDIGGTDACTEYDQIAGTGSVIITGDTILRIANLNGYVPSQFEKFIIVDNDSTDQVQGIFSGLAQGDTINLAGVDLTINYQDGSDGNDITLTAKGDQTITFTQPDDQEKDSKSFVLSGTASSGLSLSYISNTPEFCTVSGNTVTFIRAGNCSITATQDGDSYYNSATEITRVFRIESFPWELFVPAITHRRTTSS